jgi:hypothetical protein
MNICATLYAPPTTLIVPQHTSTRSMVQSTSFLESTRT